MLESCLGPFSWQEWAGDVCLHASKCLYCNIRCECGLHMYIWSEKQLISASSDTGHWGTLSKLWILTATDKTAVILSHQIGHVTPDHATGTGQTLRRRSSVHLWAQRGPTLTGPVSSLVVCADAHHQNNYSFWAEHLAAHSPRHSVIYTGFVKPPALQTHCHNLRALHLSDALVKLIMRFRVSSSEVCLDAVSQIIH